MNRIKDIFKSTNAKKYTVIIFAIIGICMIALTYASNGNKNENMSNTEDYGYMLEARTEKILESILGDDTTRVMITFKNYYSANEKTVTGRNAFTMQLKNDSSDYTEIPTPEIAGVMIVCRKLSKKEDFETVKQAVSVGLDIPQNKIYIIGGKADNENYQQY